MEDLKIIKKLPNSTEYLTKLITAANAGDEGTIGEVFEKLEQELKKIREESSITFEISKNKWNDPEAHFRRVQVEENMDAQKEISDLFRLYKVAKSANYTAGMELISSKLGGITPDMIDSLSEIGKKHK